jgi:DNA-binding NtrC family response regulator
VREIRNLESLLLEFEREQIVQALEAAQGNKSTAAEQLGIPRARLYRRMEALGLE